MQPNGEEDGGGGLDGRVRERLADVVHDQLKRLIMRGEFPKGLKLPPENDLALRFGVSRPVVREALAQLREEGVVRSQKGSGTIVVVGPTPMATALPPIRSIGDLMRFYEFRVAVEGATAGIAAERRSLADVEAIERVLDGAEEMIDGALFQLLPDVNFSFHRAIAQATQNPYYTLTLESLPNFVGRSFLDMTPPNDPPPAERAARIQAEHRAIFAAIKAGDPQRARIEMERHILSARDALLEAQPVSLTPTRRLGGRGGRDRD